jgi:hypothetical protein
MPRYKQGAILSLNNNHHRKESSIIYNCAYWDTLVKCLESPLEYMRMEGINDSPVSWTLLSPPTVVMRAMEESPHSTVRSAFFAGMSAPSNAEIEEFMDSVGEVANIGERKVRATSAALITKAERYLEEFFADGGYQAEFATYTKVLSIRYKPKKRNVKFKGKLEPPTLVTVNGTETGNIHFDIEMEQDRSDHHRAAFADCSVCVDGQIYSVEPTIYIIGDLVVKCYRL